MNATDAEIMQAYAEGLEAFDDGLQLCECPYAHTDHYCTQAWHEGWATARRQRHETDKCVRCQGRGTVTLKGAYYGGDADDQPCPECH